MGALAALTFPRRDICVSWRMETRERERKVLEPDGEPVARTQRARTPGKGENLRRVLDALASVDEPEDKYARGRARRTLRRRRVALNSKVTICALACLRSN